MSAIDGTCKYKEDAVSKRCKDAVDAYLSDARALSFMYLPALLGNGLGARGLLAASGQSPYNVGCFSRTVVEISVRVSTPLGGCLGPLS
jgi:hypothetical protein